MWHLGNISARQGLLVDARANFHGAGRAAGALAGTRAEKPKCASGSAISTAPISKRDWPARAHASSSAMRERRSSASKQYAADLKDKGKDADALRLLTEAAQIDPDDMSLRQLLRGGPYRARRLRCGHASLRRAPNELQDVADGAVAAGPRRRGHQRCSRALPMRIRPMRRFAPDMVKRLVARGDVTALARCSHPMSRAAIPSCCGCSPKWSCATGTSPKARRCWSRMLADDPRRRDALVILGCSVAEVNADAGYECIEVAARTAIAADEWGSAAAALNEFVNRVPNHIPALMRLVEICVDGGLEATMHSAQAQLADAYLTVGAGARGAGDCRGSRGARALGPVEYRAVPACAHAAGRNRHRRASSPSG